MDDDDDFEQTLLIIKEGHVYKIPPRQTSAGFRCSDWDPHSKGPLAVCRVRVIGIGDKVEIRLEEVKTGNLFATCIVVEDMTAVEQVLDSSRYFVLKITGDSGQHAFIGLGFKERSTAFDLNVSLQDHFRWVRGKKNQSSVIDDEEQEEELVASTGPAAPSMALKEGETIKVAIKGRTRRRPQAKAGGALIPPPPAEAAVPAVPRAEPAATNANWATF